MIIYLRNGQVIETADEFERSKTNAASGILSSLNWSRTPGKPTLYYADLGEVVAVVDIAPETLEAPQAAGAAEAEA